MEPATEGTPEASPLRSPSPAAGLQVESAEKAKVSFNVEEDDGGFFSSQPAVRSPGSNSISQSGVHRSFATSGQGDEPIVRDIGIPLQFVIEHVEHYVEANELYRQLAIFLPFLLCFVFWFVASRDVEQNYYIMKGMRDRIFMTEFPNVGWQLDQFRSQMLNNERLFIELDKDYLGIGNDGDWGDWFRDVIVTTTFDCQNPDSSRDLLLPQGQDYHIGAFRFRTQRMPQFSCKPKEVFYPANTSLFPRSCYAPEKESKELKGQWCNYSNPVTGEPMFEYKKCSEVPGAPLVALEGVYHCGGFMFEIPFTYTCNQALMFHDIAVGNTGDGCPFVDNWGTRLVVIEWFVYTPATDSFHGIKLYTEVPPGGFWIDQYLFNTFQVWSPTASLVLDVVVLLFVLYYWGRYFADIVRYYRTHNRVLGFFIEFWNILELANLVTFVAMYIIRFIWMSTSASARKDLTFPFKPEYPPHLDRIMYLYMSQVYANSVNTILTFLKFLKFVRLNARLNVLTRTLALCQQNMFGVLVLFVCVVLGYAIAGWGLYGIEMSGYRNLGVSMSTLVQILVGNMDYESMRDQNRFLTGAFFWTFVILGLFLLLNFIIAIISDSFAAVSGKAFEQDIEELLLREWQQLKAVWAPHNVKRQFRSWFAGKSELKMLRLALEQLKQVLVDETERGEEAQSIRVEARRALLLKERLLGSQDEEAEVELELEETQEVVVLMHRHHWREWLDADVHDTLGEHFFTYTWEDLMNEWDDARKSSEEVDKRRMFETVRDGVMKVAGEELHKVDKLDEMLTQLESETMKLVAALAPQP